MSDGVEHKIDVTVVSAHSVNSTTRHSRARYDGHAAGAAENRKRRRYPDHDVLPFVLEDLGRPGKQAVALVRALATYSTERTVSAAATYIWQSIQAIMHGRTAQQLRTSERSV